MTGFLPVFTSPRGENEVLEAYQTVLSKWRVPYTESDVPTSFGLTHVIASGPATAPPVVLLHALFATATSWYRTVDELSQSYRTYAVDVIGEANKSRPTRPITSLDEYLQWFTELVDALGISQMDLIGNSFGGFTAAFYAMRLPNRIRRLVLVGPAATIYPMPSFYVNMFIPKTLNLLIPWLPARDRTMRRSIEWMHAGLPGDPEWQHLFGLAMIHGRMTSRVFPRVYSHEEFAHIQAPTLLVLGDREKIYPAHAASEAAKKLMPDIQVKTVPRAHHITALAQPKIVNASILQFFQAPECQSLQVNHLMEVSGRN